MPAKRAPCPRSIVAAGMREAIVRTPISPQRRFVRANRFAAIGKPNCSFMLLNQLIELTGYEPETSCSRVTRCRAALCSNRISVGILAQFVRSRQNKDSQYTIFDRGLTHGRKNPVTACSLVFAASHQCFPYSLSILGPLIGCSVSRCQSNNLEQDGLIAYFPLLEDGQIC